MSVMGDRRDVIAVGQKIRTDEKSVPNAAVANVHYKGNVWMINSIKLQELMKMARYGPTKLKCC